MKMTRILFMMLSFSALSAFRSEAQTYFGLPVKITVPVVLNLQPAASPPLNFNFNSTAALDNGIVVPGTTLTYHSNKAWFVTIQTGSAFFSGGQGTMPASVLKFKNSQVSTFTDLGAAPKPLVGSLSSKMTRGTGTIGVDFRMDPGYQNPPADNYSITVIYTISNL